MDDLIKLIQNKLTVGLPGESAHQKMAPINRPISSLALKENTNYKESAVAVILHSINEKPHIILTERQVYKGAHSGQISFPGGKKENDDSNLKNTAIRETSEEIGLILHENHFITQLTQVYIPVSNFLVEPYLFVLNNEISDFNLNEREVANLIHFPIEKLLDETIQSTMEIKLPNGLIQKNIPCFQYDEKNIWGATALILNELREIII
jgi:8-oxo-dGTP pyrophosphatase MutT (NUDIX family)